MAIYVSKEKILDANLQVGDQIRFIGSGFELNYSLYKILGKLWLGKNWDNCEIFRHLKIQDKDFFCSQFYEIIGGKGFPGWFPECSINDMAGFKSLIYHLMFLCEETLRIPVPICNNIDESKLKSLS